MLFRKLIRTMGQYRAQFISMVIMIALGIGVFVGFNMEWYTLETDVDAFLEKTHFADYRIVSAQGFTEADREAVQAAEGVDAAARYLSVNTTVKDDTDVLALTVTEDPGVSGFLQMEGSAYDAEDEIGFWLSDRYAAANEIQVNDELTLVYKNLEITGIVRGLVKSGEYLICLPDSTQLMPDYSSSGFVYASPALLKAALGREYYSQINVLSKLEKKDFAERVRSALGETLDVVSKDDTVSYSEAMGESSEGKTMGSILPVLFLAIAVLTMVTTMHRLTASEKTQIGTLKSLGFRDGRIIRHYASYALGVGLLGTALGIGIGWVLGWYIMNPGGAMGTYLDMDDWSLAVPPFVWFVLVGINLLLTGIGLLSVRSMLRGTAADALRAYTPRKVRRLLLERLPLWDKLSFGARWNLRDSFRYKARTLMTVFGVVGCTVLLVGSFGMKDTMDAFLDTFYDRAIQYENRINLDTEHLSDADVEELTDRYQADRCAQLSVQIDGDGVLVEIYQVDHDLVRFIGADSGFVSLPEDGVLVCQRIAEAYGLTDGSLLTFSPFGSREEYTVTVKGTVRSMSESVVMSEAYADRIGLQAVCSSLFTKAASVAPDERILNVQAKQTILDSFDTFMEIMILMLVLLVVAAVILGIVVLYNLGVMSYTERYREMATLKVIGFNDRRIGRLLVGQNVWITVLGVLLGLPLGYAVLHYLIHALASEYEMELVLGPVTYAASILLTFGVSLLVGLMLARKNRKINMVEALKGQE